MGFAGVASPVSRAAMKSKASVRPTKPSAVVLLVMAPLFLVFGVALCGAAEGEARPYVMMFLVIWVVACGSMIVYALSILFSKRPPAMTEIDIEDMENDRPASGLDFESKLRSSKHCGKKGSSTERNIGRSARRSWGKNGSPDVEDRGKALTDFRERVRLRLSITSRRQRKDLRVSRFISSCSNPDLISASRPFYGQRYRRHGGRSTGKSKRAVTLELRFVEKLI